MTYFNHSVKPECQGGTDKPFEFSTFEFKPHNECPLLPEFPFALHHLGQQWSLDVS